MTCLNAAYLLFFIMYITWFEMIGVNRISTCYQDLKFFSSLMLVGVIFSTSLVIYIVVYFSFLDYKIWVWISWMVLSLLKCSLVPIEISPFCSLLTYALLWIDYWHTCVVMYTIWVVMRGRKEVSMLQVSTGSVDCYWILTFFFSSSSLSLSISDVYLH